MLWVAGGNPRPPALSDNPAWYALSGLQVSRICLAPNSLNCACITLKGKLYLKTNLSLTKHGYYAVVNERLLWRDSEVKQNEEAKFCKSFQGQRKRKPFFIGTRGSFTSQRNAEKSVEAAKKSRLQMKGFRSSCKICEKVFLLYTLSKKEAVCPPLSDRQCKSGGGVPLFQHLWWTLNSINK